MSTMTNKDIQHEVTAIVTGTMNLDVPGPEADLIAAGQLDSLALVDLLVHIEGRFGVSVPLETMEISDFRSVASISGLVAKHLAAA